MSITSETRKRLWARSGNRCALCRKELVRDDVDGLPGALIGEEAHIVARSPGGPRYAPLDPEARDGYSNLLLLCANDHTQVDAQPTRYTVELLENLKRSHERWVTNRLHPGPAGDDSSHTRAVVMVSGAEIWDLMFKAYGYDCGADEDADLTDAEADLVDDALQAFVDWGEIGPDVVSHGFRAMRDAKRSVHAALDDLTSAGFVVLGGERQGSWAGGTLTGKVALLRVVRADHLHRYVISQSQERA
ncbi:hypothetical protein ACIG47_13330 [Promicromonospora sp. NPDC052451]|uniref:hypothetical protein n=1 Tax=Promicromonospora sp. NPDC052451 TaxID=3364407 RepID=UPI0037CB0EC0